MAGKMALVKEKDARVAGGVIRILAHVKVAALAGVPAAVAARARIDRRARIANRPKG